MTMDTRTDAGDNAIPFYATGKRSRDLAIERGISEAELLAAHHGPEVVRLHVDPKALVEALPALGEVMVLTRNDIAVHEKVGTFGGISITGAMGLVINQPLDLRLFLGHWRSAVAVEIPDEKGPRRSIQIFDASGEAVFKIHLRPASDVAAFEALCTAFADPAPAPLVVVPFPVAERGTAADAEAFRRDFAAMADVHEFFPLLKRHGVDRRGALDLMSEDDAVRLGAGTATKLLEAASAGKVPIMCFVGSRGVIQIHTGPVDKIKAMGPWINVLDPGFDLHLREDLVTEAFRVRKPTRSGPLTAIELYDRTGALVVQFYGVREHDQPESLVWAELAASLG